MYEDLQQSWDSVSSPPELDSWTVKSDLHKHQNTNRDFSLYLFLNHFQQRARTFGKVAHVRVRKIYKNNAFRQGVCEKHSRWVLISPYPPPPLSVASSIDVFVKPSMETKDTYERQRQREKLYRRIPGEEEGGRKMKVSQMNTNLSTLKRRQFTKWSLRKQTDCAGRIN